MDEAGNIKIYDVDGNEVALNVNGKYRINVVIVSYQSAFIVVNSALYFASKLIKAIKCFGFAVFVSPLACAGA
jgi:hypothetical protein